MPELGSTAGAVHCSAPAPESVPSTPVATVYSSVICWLLPVINLISMLFHLLLVALSHWINSGLPSRVVAGVSGETSLEEPELEPELEPEPDPESSLLCRATWLTWRGSRS